MRHAYDYNCIAPLTNYKIVSHFKAARVDADASNKVQVAAFTATHSASLSILHSEQNTQTSLAHTTTQTYNSGMRRRRHKQ
jgi:hypothetical protein